ncbi:MAG: tRNA (adenosine(37)-N6)-threonylcarbamoyltransferase complex ATPase subunit type 1 TsaE [Dehalococcoidia bacterium]|nr:tRNA (adenosine(37)-N6)-threonylcarbamoyltransferase complex ATPase subunit type 1 TsaE [Dehalococcoidia bacterium]
MNLRSESPEETQRLGNRLGRLAQPGDLFMLVGGLGAGKTCLTQGIAWGLDIDGYATSPTFVVINQYRGRLPLYHIDLYRLDSIEEVVDLGLDDYLYGNGVCVVEWADKAMNVLPPEHLLVEINYLSDTVRNLVLNPSGKRYTAMLSQFKQGQETAKKQM